MAAIISVLIILSSVLLILAVLIQNPKGGGLASGFTTGAQVMGVRRTADFLENATWILVVLIFVLSIFSTPKTGAIQSSGSDQKMAKDMLGKSAVPSIKPNAPGAGAPTGGK